MTNRFVLAACAALSVAASGAVFAEDAAKKPETPKPEVKKIEAKADTVVATVNGVDITVAQMIVARDKLPAQYKNLPNEVLFKGVLDQIVQQTLLAETNKGEDSTLVKTSVAHERRALRAAEAIDALIKAKVTDAAIAKAYDEKYAKAEPKTEFNAAHILVKTEDEAKALIKSLDDGGDFTALAKEKSTGPSGKSGGKLGWFGQGMMVPPFEKAVTGMKPGTYTKTPVKTRFGWHVIMLNETRKAPVPELAKVRGEIEKDLQNKVVQSELDALKKAAKVDRSAAATIDPAVIKDFSILVGKKDK